METEPDFLEKEAHAFLAEEKFGEAYALFKKAGAIYRKNGAHKEAAMCLASAASCWALKSGERAFYNSSLAYEEAAREAEGAGDFEYASLLYRQAAINYERDMEFSSYSECFYRSREALRRFLTLSLFSPKKKARPALWFSLTLSFLIWGHGERPIRTFYTALLLVMLPALFYTQANLIKDALVFKPDFPQALYFSVITFTTVGYGDITPVGAARLVAMIEVFSGIFVIPIFIVGLSRKYLRI